MNKSVKRISCLLLGGLMAFGVSGCGNKKQSSSDPEKVQKYDTETRPIVFSTDALDGNFNPFFATSATDSTIAAMTQVGNGKRNSLFKRYRNGARRGIA